MVDQGFPRGGDKPRRSAPTYYLAIFFRKLQEKESIWTGGGEARPTVTFF